MFTVSLTTIDLFFDKFVKSVKAKLLEVTSQFSGFFEECKKTLGDLLLWFGSSGGMIMVLTQVLLTDVYLILKPFIFSILPRSDYQKAFGVAREEVARFWLHHGELFHKYTVKGFDKLPKNGAAVLIYYHGAVPIDYICLIAKTFLEKKRMIRSIMDRNFRVMPGFETFTKAFGCSSGNRAEVVQMLRRGHMIGIAPGGGYEAQLAGKSNYPVMWKKREGFAFVAREADVPIFPIFTENIREAYINMESGMDLWMKIYNFTRMPLTPLYGGFPVKLTTHIGDPIYPRDFATLGEFRNAVLKTMEAMIQQHQHLPGDIVRGIAERLIDSENEDETSEEEEPENLTKLLQKSQIEVYETKATVKFDDSDYGGSNDGLTACEDILENIPVRLPNGKLVLTAIN